MYCPISGRVRSSAPNARNIGSMVYRPIASRISPSTIPRIMAWVMIRCTVSRFPAPSRRATTLDVAIPTPRPTEIIAKATGKVKPIAASGSVPSWPTK